jgi:hypothetical protein
VSAKFTISEQIACVSREIRLRGKVYRRWVLVRNMSKNKADYELECMRSVLQTLQELDEGERLL